MVPVASGGGRYHIYRIDDEEGTITRITSAPVQDTAFLSDVLFVPGVRYMVRALQLVTSASGSYDDLSLGAIDIAEGQQVADCMGMIGGPAIPGSPCDDGDETTQWEAWDESCECAVGPIGIGESSKQDGLRLWPSPADDVVVVAARVPGGGYIIRSMDSAEVARGTITSGTGRVPVARLPNGAYTLEYRSMPQAVPVVRRFIVAH